MHRRLLHPLLFLYCQLSTSNSQYRPWWCSTWRPFTLMPKRSCFRCHSIINIHWRLWNLLWNPAWCCFRWQFPMMSTWWFEMTAIFTLKLTWCCFSKYVVLDDNCSLDAKMVSVAQSRQKGVFIPPAENLDSYTPPPQLKFQRVFTHFKRLHD